MAYFSGTATGLYDFLDKLKTHAATESWSAVKDAIASSSRELFLSNSVSNTVIGFKEFTGTGYANLRLNVCHSYDSSLDFYNQVGSVLQTGSNTSDSGWQMPVMTLQNNPMNYFLTVSVNAIVCFVRISGVTSAFYLGRIEQAGTPGQYAHPHFAGSGSASTNMLLSNNPNFCFLNTGTTRTGVVKDPFDVWNKISNTRSNSSEALFFPFLFDDFLPSKSGKYKIRPIEIFSNSGYLGSLENLFYTSGYDLSVESEITQDTKTYKIFNNGSRLTLDQFILLKEV